MIHDQVYQKTYDYLKDAYGEEQAKAIATQQADSFMVDVQEDKGSGAQQAAIQNFLLTLKTLNTTEKPMKQVQNTVSLQ